MLQLTPSDQLTQNELDAAKLVVMDDFNPQMQPRFSWPASFAVSRAYIDQLTRDKGLAADRLADVTRVLNEAERARPAVRRAALTKLVDALEYDAALAENGPKVQALAGVGAEAGRTALAARRPAARQGASRPPVSRVVASTL
ncbi:MAG: hypothetical protein IPK33_13030 [Gemmatimonadetes bacterium]|nr:hypothetical protein [Gemmatimonadota bacterium]